MGKSAGGAHTFFQAEHALYTPGLDENRGSSDFIHDIWICYKVQCTKGPVCQSHRWDICTVIGQFLEFFDAVFLL